MIDLSALKKLQEDTLAEIEENEKRGNNGDFKYPVVYPFTNGTFRVKLLFNIKSGMVQRKIIRHKVGKEQISCGNFFGDSCPVCDAIKNAEELKGKECGAWKKYGYKVRGICYAVLTSHDKNMFVNDGDPKDGDVILLMYPKTVYDEIAKKITESGEHIMSLVGQNEGKTLEIKRWVESGFPKYSVSVYAYGDEKACDTEQEFEDILNELPDIREIMCPQNMTEEALEKAKAAAETITAEYIKGSVLNPDGDASQVTPTASAGVENAATMTSAPVVSDEPVQESTSTDGKPACFGHYPSGGSKECLLCPLETECICGN